MSPPRFAVPQGPRLAYSPAAGAKASRGMRADHAMRHAHTNGDLTTGEAKPATAADRPLAIAPGGARYLHPGTSPTERPTRTQTPLSCPTSATPPRQPGRPPDTSSPARASSRPCAATTMPPPQATTHQRQSDQPSRNPLPIIATSHDAIRPNTTANPADARRPSWHSPSPLPAAIPGVVATLRPARLRGGGRGRPGRSLPVDRDVLVVADRFGADLN